MIDLSNGGRAARERAHFDRLADEQGDVWWGHKTVAGRLRLATRAALVGKLIDSQGEPVCLELGCGIGTFSEPLLQAHPHLRLVGIDISPRCIELARQRLAGYAQAEFRVGDASRLDLPSSSVDLVLGNSVLHHLELERTLAEIRRVLRPGGWLWFSEPNMLNPQIALERNVPAIGRRLQNSPDETAFIRPLLTRLLARCGFVNVKIRPYDFLHPGIPSSMVKPASWVCSVLERTPLLREIAGSLEVRARRA